MPNFRWPVLGFVLIFSIHGIRECTGQVCLDPPNFACTATSGAQVPLALPSLFVDGLQMVGAWYEFMAYQPVFSYTNLIIYYVAMGPPGYVLSGVFPGTDTNINRTLSGPFMNVTVTLNALPSKACSGNFEITFFGNDGRINTLALLVASGSGATNPVYLYFDLIYTDYTNVVIYSLCGNMNFATNMCDKPIISVLTRQRPTQMSQATKQSIQATVDAALKPYCLSSSQLSFSAWDDTLPVCLPPGPPLYVDLINLVAGVLTGSPPPNPPA